MGTDPATAERKVRQRGLRIYRAESAAAAATDVPLLDGSCEAAQEYVDRVVRTVWWRQRCDWRSVVVEEIDDRDFGGEIVSTKAIMRLGYGDANPHRVAIADPWVILHELAHLMADSQVRQRNHHTRLFAHSYLALVRRFLGTDAAAALRAAFIVTGVPYRG